MSQTSPRVGLPYLMPSQAQKHVTHNEALQRLDVLTQLSVLGFGQTTPPALPSEGDLYALGGAPTGAWAGSANMLAYWNGTGWLFLSPPEGCRAWGQAETELRVWHNDAWQPATPQPSQVDLIGINATADSTNRLSVSAAATLFSHEGADHQVKINKAGATDTASVVFQSGWAGHAEIGLAGTTALSVKISPDGQTWHEALRADPDAEEIRLAPAGAARMILTNTGLTLDVPLTGSAVQAGATDSTAGRLMPVGAFGLGGDAASTSDLDALTASGTYRISTAQSAAGHAPYTADWMVVHVSYDPGTATQTALSANTATPVIFYRNKQGGLWGDWTKSWSQANALGTVNQTTGVPTGALIERGSNTNGEYVRFADGTQICTVNGASTFTTTYGNVHRALGTLGSWTYPAVFADRPTGVLQFQGTGVWGICVGLGTTSMSNRVLFSANALSAVGISYNVAAIGRWF